jgi:putative inorganic carbon (HCO3(-)) transporter
MLCVSLLRPNRNRSKFPGQDKLAIISDISSRRRSGVTDVRQAEMSLTVERISVAAARWTVYAAVVAVPLLIVSPDAMFGYADVPRVAAARALAALLTVFGIVNGAASVWRTGRVGLPAVRARWLTGAITAFLLANVISTALSVTPSGSFAGAYPGYDGADLYSLLSYVVIGAGAAACMRERRHVMRLLAALALAGAVASLYGIAQSAGFDPLHFARFEVNSARTPLTFGNPSFAGSFLSISLFATAGLFMFDRRGSWKISFALWAMFAVQAFALGSAASRGSWVGVAVGGAVFAGLAMSRGRRSRTWPRLTALAIPFVIAFALLASFSPGGHAGEPASRLQSLNGDLVAGGLNGRLTTWRASLGLISARPWIDGEPSNAALRGLFGYGPDTFRYAYQLVAPDEHVASFVPHAHNSALNVGVELGALGLVAWTVMTITVIITAARLALSGKSVFWVRMVAASLAAAYTAHAVDQLANVSKASDTLAMWALTGALLALVAVARRCDPGLPVQAERGPAAAPANARLSAIGPAIAIPLVAAVIAFTWVGNAGHLRADFEAANLQSAMLKGAKVSTLSSSAGAAADAAPDVPLYHTLEAMALDSAAAAVSPFSSLREQLSDEALDARRQAASGGILPGEQFSLARSLYVASVSQPVLLDDAVTAYERLTALTPNYWAAWLELAAAYGRAGRVEEGVAALKPAAEMVRRQPAAITGDPETLAGFEAVHRILGLEPGTHFP